MVLSFLEQANDVIAQMAKDYEQTAGKSLTEMGRLLKQAQEQKNPDLIRTDLFRLAHDMKGQGATFGYPLLTDAGNHLCRFVEKADVLSKGAIKKIRVHLDFLQKVLAEKIKGEHPELFQDFLKRVE